jgi:hypothetical protein
VAVVPAHAQQHPSLSTTRAPSRLSVPKRHNLIQRPPSILIISVTLTGTFIRGTRGGGYQLESLACIKKRIMYGTIESRQTLLEHMHNILLSSYERKGQSFHFDLGLVETISSFSCHVTWIIAHVDCTLCPGTSHQHPSDMACKPIINFYN